MKSQDFNASVGFQFGCSAAEQAGDRLDNVCLHEKRRRELVNRSDAANIQARLRILADEREEARRECWRTEKHETAVQSPRGMRLYYIAMAAVFVVAGFTFAHLGLAPFPLGWHVWPYAVALALVGVFATDDTLETLGGERLRKALSIGMFLCTLGGLLTLAFLRADILALHIKSAIAGALPDGATLADLGETARFYSESIPKLKWFFGLLTVAMELGAGLAIHEARKIKVMAQTPAQEDPRKRLHEIENEMAELVRQLVFLQNEPAIFEAEIKRNFYLGLSHGAMRHSIRDVLKKIVLPVLLVGALGITATAQPPVVVTGLDLSASSLVRGFDGNRGEYEKNLTGVVKLIEHLPAGAVVKVVGINDQSFARPAVLLADRLPATTGDLQFLDQVDGARRRLAVRMRGIGSALQPQARRTDVLGFLILAGDMLRESGGKGRRVLVIFSDMRQSAPPLDIEKPARVSVASALRIVEQRGLLADLRGVDVYVYGVHAGEKDIAYWQSLREFWTAYFTKSNASLQSFSMMREVADMGCTR